MYPVLLLDTNVIIEQYQKNSEGLNEIKILAHEFYISVISICELFSFPGLSKTEEEDLLRFISNFRVIGVNFRIAMRAAELIRTRPNRKHRNDLIIAASALILNIPILTKNNKDFTLIPGLKVA